jgi:hypothetical protein
MNSGFKITGSLVLAALVVAASAYAEDAAQPLKKRSEAHKKASAQPSVQEQIQALRLALEAQSAQINSQSNQIESLKKDLAEKDGRLQKTEQQAAEAQAMAEKANAAAASEHQAVSENSAAVATFQTSVNTVKANAATLARNINNETAQLKKERANPTTLYFKGISLTPGGILAADTAYRGKATASDVLTPFNNLPYEGDDRYKLSEFYGSARSTRISLLFESQPQWGALRGYYEADFLGSGTNSSNYDMNSYMLRMRVLYGEAERKDGWKVAFGQMWSLATEGDKGIPSNTSGILHPLTIDPNFVAGFVWTRQWGVRVVKSVDEGKFTFGVAAENPQLMYTASLAGNTPYAVLGSSGNPGGYNAAISGVTTTTYVENYVPAVTSVASTGYLPEYGTVTAASNVANYSFNAAPDLLVKAVADPGWGHYEIFGLVGFAHETIYPGVTTNSVKYGGQYDITCPANVSACSSVASVSDPRKSMADSIVLGGAGASMRVPVVANKISFGAKALYGPGVGRYGASTLADVTSRADGSLAPIHNLSGLLTLEWTPSKRWTLWGNYGGDYAARADYSSNKTTGLSDPTPCYGGYNTDAECISPANMNASTLAANSGTWGGYWGPPTVQAVGYGSRQAINYGVTNDIPSGCNVAAAPGYSGSSAGYYASAPASCVGHTRNVQEVTGGYYYDFYKGSYGRLRQGIQYGYAVREGWSGQTLYGVKSDPKGIDNMLWTSLRYYLP